MQDYFTKHHFELLEQWKEKDIDRSRPEQSLVYTELKNAYQVTEDWAKQVAARVFPNGYVKLVKKPTNQAGRFAPYNWAKIYPAPDSPTQLAYTVGIDAAGILLMKIDTVGLSENDPVRQAYLSLRGRMDNSSPFVAVLTMDEGLSMGLDALVEWSVDAIGGFEFSYDEVVEMVGLSPDGSTVVHQEPMTFENGAHGVFLDPPPIKKVGKCMDIWVVAERLTSELGRVPSTDEVRRDPRLVNANSNNVNIEFPRWRQWRNWAGAEMSDRSKQEQNIAMKFERATLAMPPLNQILFGPPGTGKTYHSINKALEILDPALLQAHPGDSREERRVLKKRFDELVKDARIRFVTFHQSFSYEDFVEGLRADLDGESGLSYRVEPGVFKSICDSARGAAQQASAIGIKENARIWKISIDGTGPSPTRQYCFAHDEARIGWADLGDLNDENLADRAEYQQVGSNGKNTLQAFSNDMQRGDVILCISSATTVQAIGVVTGDYFHDVNIPDVVASNMGNVRPVQWLALDLDLDIRKLNDGTRFTLKTVYEISRFSWPELAGVIESAGIKLKGASSLRKPLDHVLIIDEINRGNVSRIFGELITLIESSKREGASEQLEVVLPYSKTSFKVPASVFLIGTMNTADRSLTGLDIALRRRFNFVEMSADPSLLDGVSVEGVDIRLMLERINERIEVLLDRDHQLGHSYFMPLRDDNSLDKLSFIFRNQILPLLQEYFFEDWQRIQWVLNDHRKADGHCFVIESDTKMGNLFGPIEELSSDTKRWKLDTEAFDRIESYRSIADAGLAVE